MGTLCLHTLYLHNENTLEHGIWVVNGRFMIFHIKGHSILPKTMARVLVARLSLRSVLACKLFALQFAALVKTFAVAAMPNPRPRPRPRFPASPIPIDA